MGRKGKVVKAGKGAWDAKGGKGRIYTGRVGRAGGARTSPSDVQKSAERKASATPVMGLQTLKDRIETQNMKKKNFTRNFL